MAFIFKASIVCAVFSMMIGLQCSYHKMYPVKESTPAHLIGRFGFYSRGYEVSGSGGLLHKRYPVHDSLEGGSHP